MKKFSIVIGFLISTVLAPQSALAGVGISCTKSGSDLIVENYPFFGETCEEAWLAAANFLVTFSCPTGSAPRIIEGQLLDYGCYAFVECVKMGNGLCYRVENQ